jgi:hypothetical protein
VMVAVVSIELSVDGFAVLVSHGPVNRAGAPSRFESCRSSSATVELTGGASR